VLGPSLGKDKDIVKVCCAIVVQYVVENVIDVILECGRCVAKAEWCYQHLKQPKTSDKCCEPFMALFD
jgi:hypothetical protein